MAEWHPGVMAHTSERENAEGETGRGVGGCLEGWSRAAIREGQAQLDWRRCGHLRHGSTSSPLHWACKPQIAGRVSSLTPQLPPSFPVSLPPALHHTHMQNKKVMPLRNVAACQRCFSTMRNMQMNLRLDLYE